MHLLPLIFKISPRPQKADSWSKAHLVPDHQEVLFQKAFKTHNLTTAPTHSVSRSQILNFHTLSKNPLKLPLILVYLRTWLSRSQIINFDSPKQPHPLLPITTKITQIHKSGAIPTTLSTFYFLLTLVKPLFNSIYHRNPARESLFITTNAKGRSRFTPLPYHAHF